MIWYIYPVWHKVSFSLIAERHVEELRKYFRLYAIDELALSGLYPATNPLLILHPFFYPMTKYAKRLQRLLARVRGIIGIDVADSDRISNLAVSMTHYSEAMIVPSTWARDSYARSGVRVPIHVLPHGVEKEWFTSPFQLTIFKKLYDMKKEKGLVYLLHFCWHSPYRKGLDLVLRTYEILRKERKDVILIAKFMSPDGEPHSIIRRLGGIIISGWLSEEQKRELYDISDIYLLFTRGGGFELNGLEAIVRGNVVVAGNEGSWTDYLPQFSLVETRKCPYVLKDNAIHTGRGREIIIEKAVDKVCEIADNLDDYKARIREHVENSIKDRYTWEAVGRNLAEIIRKYI